MDGVRLRRAAGLHPPRAGRRRRRRRARHAPRRPRPDAARPPTAGCSRPSPARRCSRCATSRSPPRPREARRRADATELRTALLSAVGHDLRTPLASIKAAAGSLRDPSLPLSEHDRAELAATIEESADRLTGLVDNLLDSSRLATGAVTPHAAPVGYDEVAPLALRGLDGAERVQLEIDERLPEVLADPGLLERVVANVVDNALRHGARRPGRRCAASAHADRVELRVVDNGPGRAAPTRADRLFAPFQRLGDRDRAGSGSG